MFTNYSLVLLRACKIPYQKNPLTYSWLDLFQLAFFFEEEKKQIIMKKILTLLLAAGAFITVQAQSKEEVRRVILGSGNRSSTDRNYPSSRDRDVILGGGGNNNGSYPNSPNYPGSYSSGNGQYQVDQVNREYDAKIQSIRNNGYLSYDEKDRAIRQLEKDRQKRLQQINGSYNNNNGRYNDCHDNGKHKGWNKKGKNWNKGNKDLNDD